MTDDTTHSDGRCRVDNGSDPPTHQYPEDVLVSVDWRGVLNPGDAFSTRLELVHGTSHEPRAR